MSTARMKGVDTFPVPNACTHLVTVRYERTITQCFKELQKAIPRISVMKNCCYYTQMLFLFRSETSISKLGCKRKADIQNASEMLYIHICICVCMCVMCIYTHPQLMETLVHTVLSRALRVTFLAPKTVHDLCIAHIYLNSRSIESTTLHRVKFAATTITVCTSQQKHY